MLFPLDLLLDTHFLLLEFFSIIVHGALKKIGSGFSFHGFFSYFLKNKRKGDLYYQSVWKQEDKSFFIIIIIT